MKKNDYIVWFVYGLPIKTSAFSVLDAVILACAKRINDGKDIEIKCIENITDKTEVKIRYSCKLVLMDFDTEI